MLTSIDHFSLQLVLYYDVYALYHTHGEKRQELDTREELRSEETV